MDIKAFDEEELYFLAIEENEAAKDILLEKTKILINFFIKKYELYINTLRIDYADLYSAGMIGYNDALEWYEQNKNACFKTYLAICVDRRIKKILRQGRRNKNNIYKDAYSLDYYYDELLITLKDVIQDKDADPLMKLTADESFQELLHKIKKELSDFECQVFELMINHYNYLEIAKILNKSAKQIDNTMQRIKIKIKKLLGKVLDI